MNVPPGRLLFERQVVLVEHVVDRFGRRASGRMRMIAGGSLVSVVMRRRSRMTRSIVYVAVAICLLLSAGCADGDLWLVVQCESRQNDTTAPEARP
jgi:hypothetical protein